MPAPRALAVLLAAALLPACQAPPCPGAVATATAPAAAEPAPRTITVAGDAEIFTAPDTFELSIGFDLQADTLRAARDGSRDRAAALLAVAEKHGIPACDIQTQDLSLRPRYDGYERHRIVGYDAARGLVLTLRDLDKVEPVLYDMLAAGANRVDHVQFHSSVASKRRAEARVLATEAARDKAAAMAGALGQQLGAPLKIDESDPNLSWRAPLANYALTNESVPHVSDTVATGRIRIHAGVAVTFALL